MLRSPRSLRHAAGLLLGFLAAAGTPVAEEVTVDLPDGGREVYEVRRADDGSEVREGGYRRFHPNGVEAAAGQYEDGARTGRWVFTRPNGERESLGTYRDGRRHGRWTEFYEDGEKHAAGKYLRGERHGPWKFWTAEGAPDPANSGDYAALAVAWPDGSLLGSGETRDGLRHGTWRYVWPSGAPLFEGRFEAGLREGAWVFHHVDGTLDPLLFSGEYEHGVRRRAGTAPSAVAARVPLAELPALGPSVLEGDRGPELEALLDSFAAAVGSPDVGRVLGSLEQPRAALPRIVDRLLSLDLTDDPTPGMLAARWSPLLREIGQGRTFAWRAGTGPEAVAANRLSILRWYAVASLTAESDEFWEFDLPLGRPRLEPGQPAPVLDPGPLLLPPFPDGSEGVRSTEAAARYAGRFARGRKDPARDAADAALRWLVDHQSPDGSWDAAAYAGLDYQTYGVTGLALLALLAGGHTTRDGEYHEYVQRGLVWLLQRQTPTGHLLDRRSYGAIYHHCIATTVVCEALAFSSSSTLRLRAQAAVEALEAARNPYGAWRYDLTPIGDSDTSVTAWATLALSAAEWSGLDVDTGAFDGAVAWVDEVTDPASGRTGYDEFGSLSARTQENLEFPREVGEAMTAAGLAVYGLRGLTPVARPSMPKQEQLLLRILPFWQESLGNDMYYWFWGAQAIALTDMPKAKDWRKALVRSLTGSQREDGDFAGSWDPNGPWGYEGGRVYSTAICALALLAPGRVEMSAEGDGRR